MVAAHHQKVLPLTCDRPRCELKSPSRSGFNVLVLEPPSWSPAKERRPPIIHFEDHDRPLEREHPLSPMRSSQP